MCISKLNKFLNSLTNNDLLVIMAVIELNGNCSTALILSYYDIQILHSYKISEKDYVNIKYFWDIVNGKYEEAIAA